MDKFAIIYIVTMVTLSFIVYYGLNIQNNVALTKIMQIIARGLGAFLVISGILFMRSHIVHVIILVILNFAITLMLIAMVEIAFERKLQQLLTKKLAFGVATFFALTLVIDIIVVMNIS
jgi:hypothetical protein